MGSYDNVGVSLLILCFMQKHREFPILFIRFNIVHCQHELIRRGEQAGLVGDLKTILLQFDFLIFSLEAHIVQYCLRVWLYYYI